MQAVPETSLPCEVAFLSRADAYPDRPAAVEVVETHFAWVFLSRDFVYKLKKPIRFRGLDLTTLAARRANCELEVALNRRLADGVYVGVVPLGRGGQGLALESPIEPVEWLVKMQRLPAERTLDRAARDGTIGDDDLLRLVDRLAAYYARAARAPWSGAEYRRALAGSIDEYGAELCACGLGADLTARVRALTAAQRSFIDAHAAALDARVAAGRVIDAHGDLRPEHVFLLAEQVQIIDCLEFSSELRLLDSAEEIAFLALELERLGHAAIASRVVELYVQRCADRDAIELSGFHRSMRALVRALLAVLHVEDTRPELRARWRTRATWYLDAAFAALAVPDAARAARRSAPR
jgi:aminoglycoside phosphotransferase family enzyme